MTDQRIKRKGERNNAIKESKNDTRRLTTGTTCQAKEILGIHRFKGRPTQTMTAMDTHSSTVLPVKL